MKKLLTASLLAASLMATASASLSASAYITYVSNGPNYDYDVHLTNTGTTTIGTFWYSWVPGKDFLTAVPTNLGNPTGWTSSVLAGTPGSSIRWVATTLLNPGQTLNGFHFTSSSTPTDLNLLSTDGITPVGTSFVYVAGAFADPGYSFVANTVPEPMSIFAIGAGLLGLARRRRSGK